LHIARGETTPEIHSSTSRTFLKPHRRIHRIAVLPYCRIAVYLGHEEGHTRVRGGQNNSRLPEQLWQAAKRRAIDERSDLRRIIIAALELYVGRSPRRKENPCEVAVEFFSEVALWFFEGLARMETCCYPVFGVQLITG
jgi:hypothetical protein